MILPFALLAAAYLLGSTPASYWAGKWTRGIDLRRAGSGNLGATNAFRVLGTRTAIGVLLVDVLKGWTAAAVLPLLVPDVSPAWALAYGAAAVLGHSFSFWVGFRGGKGVATSAGVFLALAPWALFAAFVVWLGAVIVTRYVSVASLVAALMLPLAVLVTPHRGGEALAGFAAVLAGFVIWAHRSNIRRLREGTEKRIGNAGDVVS